MPAFDQLLASTRLLAPQHEGGYFVGRAVGSEEPKRDNSHFTRLPKQSC
jgi:hypothetical protein